MPTPTVGLTGGIACGKSTVAGFFRALGVPVVDADALAREVVAPGTEALAEIVARFGRDVLDADGSLDRKGLGRTVFSDPAALAALNAITHPRVAALSAARVAALDGQGHPYVLYEAALLVENGLHRALAALVVVTVAPAVQHARVMARDGLTEAEATARIRAQLPLEEKVRVADFVIDTGGPREATRERVAEVHAGLVERLGRGARP